jgi:hypothetical protein
MAGRMCLVVSFVGVSIFPHSVALMSLNFSPALGPWPQLFLLLNPQLPRPPPLLLLLRVLLSPHAGKALGRPGPRHRGWAHFQELTQLR